MPPPPPSSSTTPRLPPVARPRARWRRRLVWLVVVLALLGGVFWAGWYAYNRGFSRKWREQLAAELRRRGLGFTATRLTLNPFAGLVAEDAHLFLLDAAHTPLLYMDRVAVDISLVNLIEKKPFLNALELRGARLTLPVDMADPDGPKFKLRRFQAKLAVLPSEVRLTQATGDFYGIQISASGRLLHPESFSPSGQPGTSQQDAHRKEWARTITDEIEKVRSSRTPPRLEIRFQGDLAQPGTLRASAQLQGDALRRGNYQLQRLRVQLDYAAGAFHLQQAELTDTHGTLTAQGDFNPATGDVHFQLQSGLDLIALQREFVGPIAALSDFAIRDTPQLQLDGRAHFGSGEATANAVPAPTQPAAPALQLTGHLALGRFAYRVFDFERGETDFSWSGDRWYLRGLRLVRPGGGGQQITGDVLSNPGQVNLRLTSTVDPMPFVGLLPKKGQEAAERLEFRDPPRVELTATGPSFADPAGLNAKGTLTLGRTRYRGVGLNRFHGDWAFAGHTITARALRLDRDEGFGTADELVYDMDRHDLRINNARTGLDTQQVGVWLDPDVYHTIAPFHFRKPPATIINGNVQFAGGRNSRLVTEVNAPGGMDYTFIKRNLPFQNIAGQVVFTEERLWLNELHGEIFNGQVHGALDLALGRTKDYTASIDLKNLDFARLTKLYFDYDTSKGEMSGEYHWAGRSDDARTLRGMGTLSVDHGNVFAIPFMGPLSGIVSSVLPGLGFDVAHQATANFLTSEGRIYTGNLDVKGLGFALYGGGWLGYMNDTMNFRVRLNSRGLPGAVLYPVSKLFEYTSQGPLSKPVWRPRVLVLPMLPPDERKPATAPPGQTPAAPEKPVPPLYPVPAAPAKPK